MNKQWLATELRRALKKEAGHTLTICGPKDCHGCASFARDCVSGIVAETTGRPMPEAAPPPPPPEPAPIARYRARFTKEERLRFLSHLDLVRTVVRSFRRAGIPLAYSQGYHPKPKLSFGPALPVGVASADEYVDFETRDQIDPEDFLARMRAAAPAGLRFLAMRRLGPGEEPLQKSINVARYSVGLPAAQRAEWLLARFGQARSDGHLTVARERNGKRQMVDVVLDEIELAAAGENQAVLTMSLAPGTSVRPSELVRALLGEQAGTVTIRREQLLIEKQGQRYSPLSAPGVC